jgi:hypothetical protein
MERYLNLEGCVTKEDDYNQIHQLVHIRYLNLDFHEYELSITPECLQTMNNYLPDLPHLSLQDRYDVSSQQTIWACWLRPSAKRSPSKKMKNKEFNLI